jgi:hypothetical protein
MRVGGAIVGAACYLGLIPFDPETMRFDGIVHRHLEIMTGAGIVSGLVYWMIAGPVRRRLARAKASLAATAAIALAITAAGVTLFFPSTREERKMSFCLFIPYRLG